MNFIVPRRDDKLANVLRHLGFEAEADLFMELYDLRKKADYSNESIEEVIDAIEKYKRILSAVRRLLK